MGYAAGFTPNPTYREVCSGLTGRNEVVRVVYDPGVVHYEDPLAVFWESHNPTQGMRQGNDVGTQYRVKWRYRLACLPLPVVCICWAMMFCWQRRNAVANSAPVW